MHFKLVMSAGALALASACSDGGGSPPPPPPPPPANSAPVFTSASTASVPEGTAGVVYTATATDADGDARTYSITGGADAARFSIVAGSGAVSFVTPPDFESPADANANNVYELTLQASDGRGGLASLAVAVTVTDVVESFRVRRRGTGFVQPLFVTGAGDSSGRLFVVQKGGLIRILNPNTGVVNAAPFLDVSAIIATASEQGLLGLAFPPNYATSGLFYIQMSSPAGPTEIRRYARSANPDVADPASGDLILSIPHGGSNHRAGWIGFGNDGFLYVASGDASAGVNAANPAQDTTSLLGKMLRIDVSGDDFPADAARDYRIPVGNPYAAGGGLPEVFAVGFRNPFRASFDRTGGNLLIGDVGETQREEIDIIPPATGGLNFGWTRFEGTLVVVPAETAPGALPPVIEYNHGAGPFEGNSVTGGVVNRGPVAALQGHYIFGDFVSENIWSLPVANFVQGTTLGVSALTRQTDAFIPDAGTIDFIASFGTDDLGNVYIVDLGGEIFRLENP